MSIVRWNLKEAAGKPLARRYRKRRQGVLHGVRSPISSKPKSYPERADVNATGISGKVSAHYPGRSRLGPERATPTIRRGSEKSAEAIISPAGRREKG